MNYIKSTFKLCDNGQHLNCNISLIFNVNVLCISVSMKITELKGCVCRCVSRCVKIRVNVPFNVT